MQKLKLITFLMVSNPMAMESSNSMEMKSSNSMKMKRREYQLWKETTIKSRQYQLFTEDENIVLRDRISLTTDNQELLLKELKYKMDDNDDRRSTIIQLKALLTTIENLQNEELLLEIKKLIETKFPLFNNEFNIIGLVDRINKKYKLDDRINKKYNLDLYFNRIGTIDFKVGNISIDYSTVTIFTDDGYSDDSYSYSIINMEQKKMIKDEINKIEIFNDDIKSNIVLFLTRSMHLLKIMYKTEYNQEISDSVRYRFHLYLKNELQNFTINLLEMMEKYLDEQLLLQKQERQKQE